MRILGAFYLRLTGSDTDVYHYLEPLYNDYRKLRRKLADGRKLSRAHLLSKAIIFKKMIFFYKISWNKRALSVVVHYQFNITLVLYLPAMLRLLVALDFAEFSLTHVDEVIDELLTTDYSCDIALPRIKKRYGFLFLH